MVRSPTPVSLMGHLLKSYRAKMASKLFWNATHIGVLLFGISSSVGEISLKQISLILICLTGKKSSAKKPWTAFCMNERFDSIMLNSPPIEKFANIAGIEQ